MTIGLGPVSIPHYLDRPEVVTRMSETELQVSDTDRWGEPLDLNVARVLQQDLSAAYPTLQIVTFPWSNKANIDYCVSVDFQRLEQTAAGRAELQANWSVRTNEGIVLETGHTSFSDAAVDTQDASSTALSRGIAQVSGEIAQALAKHSTPTVTQ
jgi:uncharacterized protein